MVRQTCKWLTAYDIAYTMMDKLNHFTGKKPAFTSLVAK